MTLSSGSAPHGNETAWASGDRDGHTEAVFHLAGPEDVLKHDELTRQQKVEILWRWEYDAAEQSVAVEEGMPGEDDDLQGRVMLALGALGAAVDVDHTGPSKQHGLPRPRLAKNG
jgi:hypothetical protein